MRLKIVQAGEEVLRQQARALTRDEIVSPYIQQLVEHMRDTMRDAPGVGLAAPQIGESVQLIVIEDRAEYQRELTSAQLEERGRKPIPFHVLINPRLTIGKNGDAHASKNAATFFEGCLSVSGYTALVSRANTLTVECLNERAESTIIPASGWYARILQHEIDHLNGILYVDRMQSRTLTTLENARRIWKDTPITEVQARFSAKS
ncbi:MAG TPA: peptide deformylase [Terriglobales bacterium]|nr:peptide deformylase [Terriglobales bacterium]